MARAHQDEYFEWSHATEGHRTRPHVLGFGTRQIGAATRGDASACLVQTRANIFVTSTTRMTNPTQSTIDPTRWLARSDSLLIELVNWLDRSNWSSWWFRSAKWWRVHYTCHAFRKRVWTSLSFDLAVLGTYMLYGDALHCDDFMNMKRKKKP